MNRLFLFLIFNILSSLAFVGSSTLAQDRFTVSGDDTYYMYDDGFYRIVYTAEYRPLLKDLIPYNRVFKSIYEKEFMWTLDNRPTLILPSTRNQVANGFATTFPRLHTVFYSGGAEMIDEFTVNSWLYILLSHETSHLYQLNAKRGYSQWQSRYFGVTSLSLASFFPPFNYTQHPNLFLPTFILEGNAVFNEGRFGNGGRLYSGASRALLLQMARAGKVNVKRLMNDHLDFPFGREKYWIGGYLQLYLAEKFGADKVNSFFYDHANHYFNPFLVNRSFISTFGMSYDDAISELLKHWAPLSSTLKVAPETAFATSLFHLSLTKDNDEIRFLASNGHDPQVLHTYDLKAHNWSTRTVNVPLGRAFKNYNGELEVTSSELISQTEQRAGLFTENYGFNDNDLNRYYYDIKGKHRVWADAKTSFFEPDLYSEHDKQIDHIGYASSSAIIGPDGSIYYFKQNGKDRTLYRNHDAVFSYKGFYGSPLEIDEDGAIYFIGPVERGSSLFVWRKGEFTRLTSSDAVVDARLITAENAIIVELTDSSYVYKTVGIEKLKQRPFEYIYFYEKEKPNKTLAHIDPPPTEYKPANEEKYNSLHDMQFDGVDSLIFFSSPFPLQATFNVRFSDPLQNHAASVNFGNGPFGTAHAAVTYTNLEHVVNWSLIMDYNRAADIKSNKDATYGYDLIERYDAWIGAAGLIYPFFKRPQWSADVSSFLLYENDSEKINPDLDSRRYTFLSQAHLGWAELTPLGYDAYRQFTLQIANENIHDAPHWVKENNIYAGQVDAKLDIFNETYLSGSYQEAMTDGRDPILNVDGGLGKFPFPIPTSTRVTSITDYHSVFLFDIRRISAELKQAFNYSLYFSKFPFSLRRFAIYALYNDYSGAETHGRAPDHLFQEAGGGAEFELLLVHRFPFRIGVTSVGSSYKNRNTTEVVLGANQSF